MTKIPKSTKIYDNVKIGKGSTLGEYTIVGYPCINSKKSVTSIGTGCIIGSNVIIYKGTKIGNNAYIEDYCRIGEDVTIGDNCEIINGERIYGKSQIGNDCIIGGYCCERSKIGNNVRHFGALIHKQSDPSTSWNETIERSPIIEGPAFIGFGSIIIGNVHIGKCAYIAAGAIVTKDIPPKHIVISNNRCIYYKKWPNVKLKNSHFFKDC